MDHHRLSALWTGRLARRGGLTYRGRLLVGPQGGQAMWQDGPITHAHWGATHTLGGGWRSVCQRPQHNTRLATLRV